VELPDLIAVFDAIRRRSGELDLRRRGEEVRLAAPAGEATELSSRDKVGGAPITLAGRDRRHDQA
jgi:hypothetical protein